jgi:hypothetical protein
VCRLNRAPFLIGSLPTDRRTLEPAGYLAKVLAPPWEIRNSAGLLGPGLDVRGEGGYVVMPPSQTQGPYEWVDRSPLAEASWLIERLTERDEATLF